MVSEAPPFWWKQKADWRAWALWPLSAAYGMAARRRLETARRTPVDAPVLCVGNPTVGGSGKTPAAIALAQAAKAMGLRPGIVSRGYGGSVSAPHLVDPDHDLARHVGDEPLLLARAAATAVTPDRAAGAALLLRHGCDFIIMDDGFQSARIHFDYALLVVDARRGIGNGHVIPAGPMRAFLVDQMRHADAILKTGEGGAAEVVVRHGARAGRAFFEAAIRPCPPPGFPGRRYLAFAGIGDPEKFFATVAQAGGEVAMRRPFADHHAYDDFDAQELLASAETHGLELTTTAKDAARLERGSGALRSLRERVAVVEIEMAFDPPSAPEIIVGATLEAWKRRRLG